MQTATVAAPRAEHRKGTICGKSPVGVYVMAAWPPAGVTVTAAEDSGNTLKARPSGWTKAVSVATLWALVSGAWLPEGSRRKVRAAKGASPGRWTRKTGSGYRSSVPASSQPVNPWGTCYRNPQLPFGTRSVRLWAARCLIQATLVSCLVTPLASLVGVLRLT